MLSRQHIVVNRLSDMRYATDSTQTSYNLLNLPSLVTLVDGRKIENTYAADGRKLATVAKEGLQFTEGTKTYNGNLVFDLNGDLEYVLFSEGRILYSPINESFTLEYALKNHLGSPCVVFVPNGNSKDVVQENDYYPFGSTFRSVGSSSNRYFRENKERISDYDWNKHDYTGRYFSLDIDCRGLSIDPMAEKYPWISPYAIFANNPVKYIDPDGREPIKPYAGTVEGFVRFMNGLSTGIGSATGTTAHTAMLRMGATNGIKPANTAPFNTSGNNRYIYTESGGWVDMAHFMFYAGRAYGYKQQKQQAQEFVNSNGFAFMPPEAQIQWLKQAGMNPVGEAVQDGYLQEFGDKFTAPHSAYSYEDLPSDKFGADFGANYFDPNSKQTFSEQIQNYLNNVLKATNPQDAPNYDSLPNEYPDKPTRTNRTTIPVYTKENP